MIIFVTQIIPCFEVLKINNEPQYFCDVFHTDVSTSEKVDAVRNYIACSSIKSYHSGICRKKNQYLTRSGISLVLSSDTFKELSTPGIIISYDLVAFYQAGALLFHSYFQARQVFELGSYYRDATQGDVDEFVAHEKIYITDEDAFNQNADSWIRRKLAIIRDSELLDTVSVSDIKSKAEGFGIDIDLEDIDGESCLKVPDGKKAVKELLRFLDEDYFEGTFSAAKYLSNSKRAAS